MSISINFFLVTNQNKNKRSHAWKLTLHQQAGNSSTLCWYATGKSSATPFSILSTTAAFSWSASVVAKQLLARHFRCWSCSFLPHLWCQWTSNFRTSWSAGGKPMSSTVQLEEYWSQAPMQCYLFSSVLRIAHFWEGLGSEVRMTGNSAHCRYATGTSAWSTPFYKSPAFPVCGSEMTLSKIFLLVKDIKIADPASSRLLMPINVGWGGCI